MDLYCVGYCGAVDVTSEAATEEIGGGVSLFLETIKEALRAIKHASVDPFFPSALKGGYRSPAPLTCALKSSVTCK